MKFVEFTTTDGYPVWVNLERIVAIGRWNNIETQVTLDIAPQTSIIVSGDPASAIQKIQKAMTP